MSRESNRLASPVALVVGTTPARKERNLPPCAVVARGAVRGTEMEGPSRTQPGVRLVGKRAFFALFSGNQTPTEETSKKGKEK